MAPAAVTDAVVVGCGDIADRGPLVVTCEHASNRVPPPLRASEADRPWLETHCGWDIGAVHVARYVVAATRSAGVLAGVTRLVCDVNRDWVSERCILSEVEGHRLTFNGDLDAAELARRKARYYDGYHDAADALVRARAAAGGPFGLLAVHSFTPVLGDEVREMEVGVLFDVHEVLARRLRDAIDAEGFVTALNAPYSGRVGDLILSATRHGGGHGLGYVELEIRQDLIGTPYRAREVGERLVRALERCPVV